MAYLYFKHLRGGYFLEKTYNQGNTVIVYIVCSNVLFGDIKCPPYTFS